MTGASGFLGSHLCETLLKKGYDVVGATYTKGMPLAHVSDHPSFTELHVDIRNAAALRTRIQQHKPRGIFHTAALLPSGNTDDPFPFFEQNARGTLNVLEAARQEGVEACIYSSTMNVYGKANYLPVDEHHPTNPDNFYGLSKLVGEEYALLFAKKYDLRSVILRYPGIYGPRKDSGAVATFIARAHRREPIELDINIAWDIVYVEDVVEANIRAYENRERLNGQVINIGSGREVEIETLAEHVVKLFGSHSKIVKGKDFSDTPSLRFYFNIDKAREMLAFEPSTLDDGLVTYITEEIGPL